MDIFPDVSFKTFKQGNLYHEQEERLSEVAGFLESQRDHKVKWKEKFSMCVCFVKVE